MLCFSFLAVKWPSSYLAQIKYRLCDLQIEKLYWFSQNSVNLWFMEYQCKGLKKIAGTLFKTGFGLSVMSQNYQCLRYVGAHNSLSILHLASWLIFIKWSFYNFNIFFPFYTFQKYFSSYSLLSRVQLYSLGYLSPFFIRVEPSGQSYFYSTPTYLIHSR